MARKNESPQKAAMREMMHDYLKKNGISIKSGTDVNSVMRDMMSVLLEGALDEELDEELGLLSWIHKIDDEESPEALLKKYEDAKASITPPILTEDGKIITRDGYDDILYSQEMYDFFEKNVVGKVRGTKESMMSHMRRFLSSGWMKFTDGRPWGSFGIIFSPLTRCST